MQSESTNQTSNDESSQAQPAKASDALDIDFDALAQIGDPLEEDEELSEDDDTSDRAMADFNPSADLAASIQTGDRTDLEIMPPTVFRNHYVGYMHLHADVQTVMDYLDTHQGWFRRCAKPFKADPIGTTGYAMGVGRVGAFGYHVDPRVGLDLLPQENGVYRIKTIPIPDQEPQGYEVDFQAEMRLLEAPVEPKQQINGAVMTSVEWDLDLTVTLQFPRFIHRLPQDVIQKTGDGVLAFVVKRVSNSLTAKVQNDFHQTIGVKTPKHHKL